MQIDTARTTLQTIIRKIQLSSFSDVQKKQALDKIETLLKDTILPVLVKHMPKEKLEKFLHDPDHATVEQYGELMEAALSDKTTMPEIIELMNHLLLDIYESTKKFIK